MNCISLTGRLARDPELRHTTADTACTTFTLAVRREYGDGTDFIDCVAWRNTAEFVAKYFSKGVMAAVNGRLQIREWTDKNGVKHRSAEVVVDHIDSPDKKAAPADEPDDQEPLPF